MAHITKNKGDFFSNFLSICKKQIYNSLYQVLFLKNCFNVLNGASSNVGKDPNALSKTVFVHSWLPVETCPTILRQGMRSWILSEACARGIILPSKSKSKMTSALPFMPSQWEDNAQQQSAKSYKDWIQPVASIEEITFKACFTFWCSGGGFPLQRLAKAQQHSFLNSSPIFP